MFLAWRKMETIYLNPILESLFNFLNVNQIVQDTKFPCHQYKDEFPHYCETDVCLRLASVDWALSSTRVNSIRLGLE